jgi:hypothetical protein
MKVLGSLCIVAIVATAFLAGNVATSSATDLCLVHASSCGTPLPVPEELTAEMKNPYALFGGQDECQFSTLELETTSNTGVASPLLAEITSWKFSGCGTCPTVTAVGLPYEAEFEPLKDGSPLDWHGNGRLKVRLPKFELSHCDFLGGPVTCFDSASLMKLGVTGGVPMAIDASSAPVSVTGAASCGTSTTFSASYAVTTYAELWLEPDP